MSLLHVSFLAEPLAAAKRESAGTPSYKFLASGYHESIPLIGLIAVNAILRESI